jgi:RNA polymerase sigma-70 factor (ECF subfamily)
VRDGKRGQQFNIAPGYAVSSVFARWLRGPQQTDKFTNFALSPAHPSLNSVATQLQKNIQAEIEAQRSYLLRIAVLQLRSEAVAEDVVQDTLIAALEGAKRFAGNSTVRTWLVGILKHKIIDQIRRGSREVALVVDVADGAEGDFDSMFNDAGHFIESPRDWGNPERTLEQKRFYEVLEICLSGLSPNLGRIFLMREFLGLETEEICKDLKISSTNCWVMLYRARMGLRACLEKRWFQGAAA